LNKKFHAFALFESLLSIFILSQFIIVFFIIFNSIETLKINNLYERDFDFYTSIELIEEEIANCCEVSWINDHTLIIQKNTLETKIIELIQKSKEIRMRGITGGFQPILMEVNDCSFQKENEHILKVCLHFVNQKYEYSAKILIPSTKKGV
jgi:competence protein ComGF